VIDDEVVTLLQHYERMVPCSRVIIDTLCAIGHEAAEVFFGWREARFTDDHNKPPTIDWNKRLTRDWMAFHEQNL
jgi:hypothetical protein